MAAGAVIEERVVWESLRWADARLGVEPAVGRECRQHEMSAAEWHASLYGICRRRKSVRPSEPVTGADVIQVQDWMHEARL